MINKSNKKILTNSWVGKKVYIKVKDSKRCYSGLVIDEDYISLTIRDIVGHLVRINLEDIGLLQEEFEIKKRGVDNGKS